MRTHELPNTAVFVFALSNCHNIGEICIFLTSQFRHRNLLSVCNMPRKKELQSRPQPPKPQQKFRVPPDNTDWPFMPRIKVKPNALIPLDVSPIETKKGKIIQPYRHPYQFEIDALEYDEAKCGVVQVVEPLPLQVTALTFIDDVIGLRQMVQVLQDCTEIAVDLEENCIRSFLVGA